MMISNLGLATSTALPGRTAASGAASGDTPFSGALKNAIQQMNSLEQDATNKVDGLLRGNGVDVHAAMLATQRSDLAFEMALAVRNKAVAAYEQLNSMQF